MSFKIIGLDLDGTIVNAQNKISLKTIDVLTKVHQEGVEIVIVTGRSLFNALSVLKKYRIYSIVNMVLASNGAVVFDVAQNKVISFKLISFSLLKKLHEWTENLKLSLVLTPISDKEHSYYVGRGPSKKELDFFLNKLCPISLAALKNKDISSGIVLGDLQNIEKFETMVRKKTSLEIVRGSPHSTQFSKTDKGSSLLSVVTNKKIEINKVLVIGNGLNDVPMFKTFPYSVAMGNSFGDTKKFAKYITESIDNDGAAKIIEKLVLNVKPQI